MKQKQPRQRPQQVAANSRSRRTRVGGYRRRGAKGAVERSWRRTFGGVHAIQDLPARRAKGAGAIPPRGSRSGAQKRRARGRRAPVLRPWPENLERG